MAVFSGNQTEVFWNSDICLPVRYGDPAFIYDSITEALYDTPFDGPCISAYVDKDTFKGIRPYYSLLPGLFLFEANKLSQQHRLHQMLVDIVMRAATLCGSYSKFVVVVKLSSSSPETEMICRVLRSLNIRGSGVILAAVDDVGDIQETKLPGGLTIHSKQDSKRGRIPLWHCPHLFDHGLLPKKEKAPLLFVEQEQPSRNDPTFKLPPGTDACVFWDTEDYPLPPDLDPRLFYDNILNAVRKVTSCTRLSMYLYVVEEGFEFDLNDPQIEVTVVPQAPKDKFTRLAKMLVDIFLWTMDSPASIHDPWGPHLVLISKPLEDTKIFNLRWVLTSLKGKGHHVFWVLSKDKMPSSEDKSDSEDSNDPDNVLYRELEEEFCCHRIASSPESQVPGSTELPDSEIVSEIPDIRISPSTELPDYEIVSEIPDVRNSPSTELPDSEIVCEVPDVRNSPSTESPDYELLHVFPYLPWEELSSSKKRKPKET